VVAKTGTCATLWSGGRRDSAVTIMDQVAPVLRRGSAGGLRNPR
jgi:hypothetical protein